MFTTAVLTPRERLEVAQRADFKVSVDVVVEDFEIAINFLFLLRALGSRCRHATSTHVVKRLWRRGEFF